MQYLYVQFHQSGHLNIVITKNNTATPKKMKYAFCGGSLDSFSSDIIVHYSKGEGNHHFNILRELSGMLLN